MTIIYPCTCGNEFEIQVSRYVPAKTYGPPEKCHPAEGGEPDVDECPKCGEPVDMGKVAELDCEAYEAARENAAERDAELKLERRMNL